MEGNPQPPKPESKYRSADEIISQMKIAFTNASQPDILPSLQTVGITAAKLANYLAQITQLENLTQQQKKEYGDQYSETDKLNSKRTEIDDLYRRHLGILKIALKDDVQASATLGLSESRKSAFASWFQQVNNFYAQLANNSDFAAKAAAVGISSALITQQQTALQDADSLKESQKKEAGEAQKATETRDEALDALYPKYTELLSYARVLFSDDQTLEKLGIVVKR